MSVRDKEFYQKHYIEEDKSINQIAEEEKTYANKIRRELKKLGFTLKSRSEVQKQSIKEGRRKPPMKGRRHSFSTREKISQQNHDSWKNADEDKKEKRRQNGRDAFKKKDKEDKAAFVEKGRKALLETTKTGSKLEQGLADGLILEGYHVNVHRKNFFGERELEIDLFLPKIKVAIEIDGPSHYSEIYGEEALEKVRGRDDRKNSILLQNGCVVVRVRNYVRNTTLSVVKDAIALVLPYVKKLESEFPPPSKRVIYLDLK